MEKYYEILEVPFNASKEQIKVSYRKLVFKYHPDKNKTPEALEKMKLINEAYEIIYKGKIPKRPVPPPPPRRTVFVTYGFYGGWGASTETGTNTWSRF